VKWVDLTPIAERAASGRMFYASDGRDMLMNSPDGWEVEQPWLWWVTGGDGGVIGNPPPGAGQGPLDWLSSLPGVTRVTQIICESIAGLPWPLYRGEYELLDPPEWIVDPQATRLDNRVNDPNRAPDVRLSRVEFWTQWIANAFWLGDGLVYVPVRDESGQPRPPIWLVDPFDVTIEDDRYLVDGEELPANSIIHLRGFPPYRGGRGTGLLFKHAPDLALAILVRGYAAAQFRSGVPAGYLKLNAANVSREQAGQVRDEWMAQHGRGRRGIAVLSALADFQAISVKPVDAELSKQREWNLRDLALAAGVPAYMLGVPGDSSTYANVESRLIELTRFTHLPWCRRIESTLDAQVPRGQRFKLNLNGLMRADTKTRDEAYKIAAEAGWMTIDEIRELEDMPPLEGGMVQ